MEHAEIATVSGSYLTPSFEHARVSDAMRAGVLTCPPDTPMRTVARMMATYHVHSIVVTGLEVGPEGGIGERAWGIVSEMDLARVAGEIDDHSAGAFAGGEVLTVTPDTPLEQAAQLMNEQKTSHLVVVDAPGGRPIGVLSTLDLAGSLAWGRA